MSKKDLYAIINFDDNKDVLSVSYPYDKKVENSIKLKIDKKVLDEINKFPNSATHVFKNGKFIKKDKFVNNDKHEEKKVDETLGLKMLSLLEVSLKRNNLEVPKELEDEIVNIDLNKELNWKHVEAGHEFKLKNLVKYKGVIYSCIQAYTCYDLTHTPDLVPNLWEVKKNGRI